VCELVLAVATVIDTPEAIAAIWPLRVVVDAPAYGTTKEYAGTEAEHLTLLTPNILTLIDSEPEDIILL
jgi:hypothetical protein